MDQLAQVLQEIDQRRRFLVTSHARPDGDAIGSTLALAQILRKMGKSAEVVLADNVPVIYRPLPHADAVIHSTGIMKRYPYFGRVSMNLGWSAESSRAWRSFLTAVFTPSSKSTNVSCGHSTWRNSSRVTTFPSASSNKRNT